jgi:hypothetical protein
MNINNLYKMEITIRELDPEHTDNKSDNDDMSIKILVGGRTSLFVVVQEHEVIESKDFIWNIENPSLEERHIALLEELKLSKDDKYNVAAVSLADVVYLPKKEYFSTGNGHIRAAITACGLHYLKSKSGAYLKFNIELSGNESLQKAFESVVLPEN